MKTDIQERIARSDLRRKIVRKKCPLCPHEIAWHGQDSCDWEKVRADEGGIVTHYCECRKGREDLIQSELFAHIEQLERAASRKVICIHCYAEVPYEPTAESQEEAWAAMLEHEKECPVNPFRQRIEQLERDLRTVLDTKRYSALEHMQIRERYGHLFGEES